MFELKDFLFVLQILLLQVDELWDAILAAVFHTIFHN